MNSQFQEEIKILVTGVVGFIGSHLVEILIKEEYEIVCLDNFKEYNI